MKKIFIALLSVVCVNVSAQKTQRSKNRSSLIPIIFLSLTQP